MKDRGIGLITALLVLTAVDLGAAFNPAEPPVLYVPVSARASALGSSLFCSEFDGVHYNPAYLALVEKAGIWGTYGLLQQGSNFGSAYGQFKAGNAGWGLGIADIRIGFDGYLDSNSPSTGQVSVSQTLFSLAAGMKGSDPNLLLGAAVRMLSDTVSGSSSSGYSADIGAGYVFSPRFRMGLVLDTILSFAGKSDDVVPQKTTLSAAIFPNLTLNGQTGDTDNGIFIAATKDSASNTNFSFGLESVFHGTLALRAGYDRDYPVLGVGFRLGFLDLDTAAAFKEAGYLYFMTLGFRFGGTVPEPVKSTAMVEEQAPAAAPPPVEKKIIGKKAQAETYARKGWEMLRGNNLQAAEKYFKAALGFDPANEMALSGQKVLEKESIKMKKKEELRALLTEADAALRGGEYIKAEETYRKALEINPDSGEAKEGIRSTVETVGIEIGETLKKGTTQHFGVDRVPSEEALAISRSGTFKNLVASMEKLSGGSGIEAFGEWMKVQPRDCGIVRKYQEAFAVFPARVSEANIAKARELASSGYYRNAVVELEKNLSIAGLDPAIAQKSRALKSSFEYVGESVGENNLQEARELIGKQLYEQAAACLERVVRCGYGAEEAKRLQQSIAGKTEGQAAPAPKPPKGKKRKEVHHASPPDTVKPLPAAPVAPIDRGSPGKPSEPPPLNPVIKERLLRQYLSAANQMFSQGNYRGCRECLLKILYLEPNNDEAKQFLNKVDGLLKKSKK